MDTRRHPALPTWLAWINDFERIGGRIASSSSASSEDDVVIERHSLNFALYARTLTLLGTCRFLAEADRLLDFRIHTRGVLECVLHLEASARDPGHLVALKRDDDASRRSRAKAFLKRQSPPNRQHMKILDEFIAGKKGAKRLNIEDLPATGFSSIVHEYREISADSAHVTFSSLVRHVMADGDGINRLIVDPDLSGEELDRNFRVLALACLASTWLFIRTCPDAELETEELEALARRYHELSSGGRSVGD